MKHITKISKVQGIPNKAALSTSTILYIVGSVFTGIGTILIAISSTIGTGKVEQVTE